jgi:hypothetical protein
LTRILIPAAAPCSNFGMRLIGRAIAAFALTGMSPVASWAQAAAAPAAGAASPSASPAPAARRPGRVPDAILPGFEALADGSTRLFVVLSQPVRYDAKVGRGVVTYVLKGARVDRRNNYNPLVTVHFNTPVTTARLLPHGRDLWFVVTLRADVQPTVTMDAAKDGGAVMRIEFPKGDYLPSAPSGEAAAGAPGSPAASADAGAPPDTGRPGP